MIKSYLTRTDIYTIEPFKYHFVEFQKNKQDVSLRILGEVKLVNMQNYVISKFSIQKDMLAMLTQQ
jgi:hypothetical protein